MDLELLNTAVESSNTEYLLSWTTDSILEQNIKVVENLDLFKQEAIDILTRLNGYKYVDEINQLKCGAFIRWIGLQDPENIFLSKGAIFCDVQITAKGIFLICKNYGYSKYFQLKMDEYLVFQKLNAQEIVLLRALDQLCKEKN